MQATCFVKVPRMLRFNYSLILIFSACTSSVLAVHTPDEIFKFGRKCNGTLFDVASLSLYTPPNTETGKCMMLCLMKLVNALDRQTGQYSESGTVNYLKKYWSGYGYPDDQLIFISQACSLQMMTLPQIPINTCEYGYDVSKCFINNLRQFGVFKDVAISTREISERIKSSAIHLSKDAQQKVTDSLAVLFNETAHLFPNLSNDI